MPPLAEPNGKLDGEIDGDADEQDGEGDGNEVQRADRHGGEAGGQQQSHDQRERDRHGEPPRPDGGEQPHDHEQKAAAQADRGTLRHGGKLLIVQGHGPGDAHPRLPARHIGQALRFRPHRRARSAAGLQSAVIEYRLGGDEAEAPCLRGQRAGQQIFPRERLRMTVRRRRERRMKLAQGRPQRRAVDPTPRAFGHQRQRGEQPAQRRVGDQLPQERLRIHRAVQQLRQVARADQQECIALQIRRTVRLADIAEQMRLPPQRFGQPGRGRLRLLGYPSLDHGDQQAVILRERRRQRVALLFPRQRGGEHAPRVGGDAQAVTGRIQAGRRQQHGNPHRHEPTAAAHMHEPREDCAHRPGDRHARRRTGWGECSIGAVCLPTGNRVRPGCGRQGDGQFSVIPQDRLSQGLPNSLRPHAW